jgi:hypothetical protein
VVSPELRVGTLQRGVSRGLGLLDTAVVLLSVQLVCLNHSTIDVPYPFRCALRDWLCWDEFFDSAKSVNNSPEMVFESIRVTH